MIKAMAMSLFKSKLEIRADDVITLDPVHPYLRSQTRRSLAVIRSQTRRALAEGCNYQGEQCTCLNACAGVLVKLDPGHPSPRGQTKPFLPRHRQKEINIKGRAKQ